MAGETPEVDSTTTNKGWPSKSLMAVGKLVIAATLIVAIGASVIIWISPNPTPIACEALRSIDVALSQEALRIDLRDQIAVGLAQLHDSRANLDTLKQEITKITEMTAAIDPTLRAEDLASLDASIALEEAKDPRDEGEIESLKNEKDSLEEALLKNRTLLESQMSLETKLPAAETKVKTDLDRVGAARSRLIELNTVELEFSHGAKSAGLSDQIKMLQDEQSGLETEIESRYGLESVAAPDLPPRSSVSLQPTDPISVIEFGPHRQPQRVEIAFEGSDFARPEAETISADVEPAELPQQAIYFAAPGQLRRDQATEISPDRIMVWARRLGPTILVSVCISPDDDLSAGKYSGDIYLVDSSLSSAKASIEVTLQYRWIKLLYLMLPIVPSLGILYVWYNGRVAAEENPWRLRPFARWLQINFVLLFGIGFASVWATLQVAFTNPTWGSTLFGSAGVIGASFVATVTAITVVAGRVRGLGIDDESL